jgi:putative hydrolase of the HAD superfamily
MRRIHPYLAQNRPTLCFMNDRMSAEEISDANQIPTEAPAEPLLIEPERRPDLSAVRAIYFDLDDTLCAYWEASKIGMRRAFEEHGPEGFTPEEMIQHWAAAFRQFSPTLKQTGWYEGYLKEGEPTRTEQMRLTLLRVGVVDEVRASSLSQTYMQERDRALRLFSDSLNVLAELKGRYPLGLITNGPADIQRQEIATLGIAEFFDHVFIEGEMGEGKPNQSVFERARSAVDVRPHEILFVGNSFAHDIVPAIEAGWRAIWIRRPSDVPPSSGPGLAMPEQAPEGAPRPDAVIGELTELLTLLL